MRRIVRRMRSRIISRRIRGRQIRDTRRVGPMIMMTRLRKRIMKKIRKERY